MVDLKDYPAPYRASYYHREDAKKIRDEFHKTNPPVIVVDTHASPKRVVSYHSSQEEGDKVARKLDKEAGIKRRTETKYRHVATPNFAPNEPNYADYRVGSPLFKQKEKEHGIKEHEHPYWKQD